MRVALGLSYEGGRYDGWQSQPSGNTVVGFASVVSNCQRASTVAGSTGGAMG